MELGQKGEQIVLDKIREISDGMYDTRDNLNARKIGIDGLRYVKVRNIWNAEFFDIKTENYDKTIFVETVSNIEANTPGCYMSTKADVFYHYLPKTKTIYAVNVRRMRELLKNKAEEIKDKEKEFSSNKDGNTWGSRGYALEIDWLIANKVIMGHMPDELVADEKDREKVIWPI